MSGKTLKMELIQQLKNGEMKQSLGGHGLNWKKRGITSVLTQGRSISVPIYSSAL